jgi:ACT domain-containing protein
MRINADLQLKDVPGQLVRALMPIAEAGGNIVSIVHERSNVIRPSSDLKEAQRERY